MAKSGEKAGEAISSGFKKQGDVNKFGTNIDNVRKSVNKLAEDMGKFKDKDFQEMFEWLKQYDAFPCLYRWEIVSPAILYPNMVETIKMRIKEISKHSSIQTPRIVKCSYPKDNTLYVGKSENIVDRIMKHLGYHQQRDKHGLHLYDLVKEMDYHIIFNLHIYVFPQECKPIMELFERSLAEVHPTLVGTHN